MTVVGVTMVKDEADIIVATIEHLRDHVDAIVVADNSSTDGTRELLNAYAKVYTDTFILVDDDEVGYYQSQKMTHLANVAHREFGADWIVPFDADEWWYSPFGKLSVVLEDVAPQWLVVPATVYNHVVTKVDHDHPNPYRRIEHREPAPLPLPKVACRWRDDLVIEMGNHGARYTGGATTFDQLLVVRHFPYRSVEQFTRKVRNGAAAYAAAGERISTSYGAHWRQWGELTDEQLTEVFETWYSRWSPSQTRIGDAEAGWTVVPALLHDPVLAL